MSSFLLKSVRGGISDYEDKGIAGSFKMGRSMDIRKKTDSRTGQQALVEETGAVTDMVNVFVPSSDGNTYCFCRDGKIFKRTSLGVYTLMYTDTYGAIIGAGEFPSTSGKTLLYWATPTRLNCKEIPGNGHGPPWDDINAISGWPKTNLTSADWHTMIIGVGALLIANGPSLALVGYDDSYTNNALNMIYGNIAKTLVERNGRTVVVGSNRKDAGEESTMLLWDTVSLSWNDARKVPMRSINAMIDTDVPLAQIGSNGDIYYSDMINVMPIQQIPGGGYSIPTGVTKDGGLALFAISGNANGDNGIYSYGRKRKNNPHVLNLEYRIDNATEFGALEKVGDDILVGYKTVVGGVTAYHVGKVSPTIKSDFVYESLDLSPPPRFQNIPEWTHAVIQCMPLPANTGIELWYRYEKTGSFVPAKMQGNIQRFVTTGGTEAVFFLGGKGKIAEIQERGYHYNNTTPEILSDEIFFK